MVEAIHIADSRTASGKPCQVWEVRGAPTQREAEAAIPGDFLVYWHSELDDIELGLRVLEIVRTF